MNFFNNKNNIFLFIIILISLGVISVSFGYFAAFTSAPANTDVTLGTEVSEKLIFKEGTDININASRDNFSVSDGNLSSSTTSTATLIANSSSNSASSSYNVYFNVIANDFVYSVSADKPEILLKITDSSGNDITSLSGLTYVTTTDKIIGETVTGFDVTTHNGLITIKEDKAISSSNSDVGYTESWNVEVILVNLEENQSLNEGKTFESSLILTKDKMSSKSLSNTIISLHNGIDGSNDLYYTNNAEYRYSGANPNNYVSFNGELWRVIGVFDDSIHGVSNEMLVKLVRTSSLGYYAVISEEWTSSETGFTNFLGNYYYNSIEAPYETAGCDTEGGNSCANTLNGLSAESRELVENAKWDSRGDYRSATLAADFYLVESSSIDASSTSSTVNIFSVSDYAYAASPGNWSTPLTNYNSSAITTNNWLFSNRSSFNLNYDTVASSIYSISYGGSILDSLLYSSFALYPTLYLKSEVSAVSGTGTEADPYVIN